MVKFVIRMGETSACEKASRDGEVENRGKKGENGLSKTPEIAGALKKGE